ncbi:hypothetical protein Bca4012_084285 [Brassica carinata]
MASLFPPTSFAIFFASLSLRCFQSSLGSSFLLRALRFGGLVVLEIVMVGLCMLYCMGFHFVLASVSSGLGLFCFVCCYFKW